MKLKEFNIKTFPVKDCSKSTKPWISIRIKGSFAFNSKAMELMGFVDGDTVQFFQDEENPKQWYVSKSELGFKLNKRESKKGSGRPSDIYYQFNHLNLYKTIGKSYELEGVTLRIKIKPIPIELNGIATWELALDNIK